ncbi:MAG: GWxTD domain-containing protein [Bacteroidota bacterium]|nr:GWxTD domain-containing protein [Bacteroidota bacterium]
MKRFFILHCLTLLFLYPQERTVREQTSGSVVYFGSSYYRTNETNTVIIPFRIRSDFFVFTKSSNSNADIFSANGEVSVELLDSTGTSIARNIRQLNLTSNDNSTVHLRTQYSQDLFTFQIHDGRYQIIFKLEDKESKRTFSNSKEQILISKSAVILSSLIPVKDFAQDSFQLFNLGRDVLFSQNYGFVFLSKHKYPSAVYSLSKLQLDEDEKEIITSSTNVSVSSFGQKTFIPSLFSENIQLKLGTDDSTTVNYISLDGLQLRQGQYEIEFTFPDSSKVKTQFGSRWLDMPISLYDLDLATEPLQFILTKDDYSELRRGGRETRIKKFEEFWKKKDTTPSTAYNEVMHEFYRRVDFAFTAFRTLREMNGAITDRGRIYIQYGKPASTERTLSPGGSPKEIWKYSSINKIFTFEDPSKQGNYKLAENK